MDFCLKCGTRLTPKKGRSENQAIIVLACNKYGQKIKETRKPENQRQRNSTQAQAVCVCDRQRKPTEHHANKKVL